MVGAERGVVRAPLHAPADARGLLPLVERRILPGGHASELEQLNAGDARAFVTSTRGARLESRETDVHHVSRAHRIGPGQLQEPGGLLDPHRCRRLVHAIDAGVPGVRLREAREHVDAMSERGKPCQLGECPRVEVLLVHRLKVALQGREIRRAHVTVHVLRGDEVEQLVTRDRAERFPAQLAASRLFRSQLVRIEIARRELSRFVVGAHREAPLVRPRLGDRVDDSALEVAVLRAGAEPANLQRLDPVHAQRKEVAAEPRVIHRDTVELIVVRHTRRAAPQLFLARARHQRDEARRVAGTRQQLRDAAVQSQRELRCRGVNRRW